jgi:hypothetical protein
MVPSPLLANADADLTVKRWIIVRSQAALECSGIGGAVKESRRNAQRGNLIPRIPCIADLIDLAPHAGTANPTN